MNRSTLTQWLALLMLLEALSTLVGCEAPTEHDSRAQGACEGLRIVSLSPAISRTLVDLEIAECVVGRTPFCASLDESLPIAGDLIDVNMEVLVRLQPTHVLVQPPASGINPALPRLAEKHGWRLGTWMLDSIDDIERLLRELPDVLSTDEVGPDEILIERSRALHRAIRQSLNDHNQESVFTGPVLLLVGIDPVTAFGDQTYLNDLLIAFGGRNVVTARGYPSFSLEDIQRMNPHAILLVKLGAEHTSPDEIRRALGGIGRLDIEAIDNERLALLTNPDALMPSSAIVNVAHELRTILNHWHEREHEP